MTDSVPRQAVERALDLEAAAPRPTFKEELWDDVTADWRGVPRAARVEKSPRRRRPLVPLLAFAAVALIVAVLVAVNAGDEKLVITNPPLDELPTGSVPTGIEPNDRGPVETASEGTGPGDTANEGTDPDETGTDATDGTGPIDTSLATSTTSLTGTATAVPGVLPAGANTSSTLAGVATAPTSTSAPVTSSRPAGSPFLVSYEDVPESYEPTPFVTLEIPANPDNVPGGGFAVSEAGAVVVDPLSGGAFVVSATGESTFVPLEVFPSYPVAGPGDVLYGIVYEDSSPTSAVPSAQMIALALSGPRSGTVVSVAEMDLGPYTELPGPIFGHGPDGVIDRRHGETIMGYVDRAGRPLTAAHDFPQVRVNPNETAFDVDGVSVPIEIVRHPGAAHLYSGNVPPSPNGTGGVIYSTWVGPALEPFVDYGVPTVPAVIIMNADGTGTWERLPDDWFVASSDVWGTLLARSTDVSSGDPTLGRRVELAWLSVDGVAVPSAD